MGSSAAVGTRDVAPACLPRPRLLPPGLPSAEWAEVPSRGAERGMQGWGQLSAVTSPGGAPELMASQHPAPQTRLWAPFGHPASCLHAAS